MSTKPAHDPQPETWGGELEPSREGRSGSRISDFRFYQQLDGTCWVAVNGDTDHPQKFHSDMEAVAYVMKYMAEERR